MFARLEYLHAMTRFEYKRDSKDLASSNFEYSPNIGLSNELIPRLLECEPKAL